MKDILKRLVDGEIDIHQAEKLLKVNSKSEAIILLDEIQ